MTATTLGTGVITCALRRSVGAPASRSASCRRRTAAGLRDMIRSCAEEAGRLGSTGKPAHPKAAGAG